MEGTPVAVLEAMAAGLPVVAFRHAGIAEAVQHGESGYLADEHDIAGLAKFVLSLLTDENLRQQVGSNARSRIWQGFTMERHIDVLDQLIEEVSR